MKALKKRQERNKKLKLDDLEKQQQKLESQVNKMNAGVDAEKAKIYAEEGGDSLVDNEITAKKDKINAAIGENFQGFANELTVQERDDLEIHRTQLAMDKDRELIGAEAEIDQILDNEETSKKLESEKEALRKKLESGDIDPDEKNLLLA